MVQMSDIEILLHINEMGGTTTNGDLVSHIRKEERMNLIDFLAKVDGDFSARLDKLVNNGLLTRRYTSGANQYSLTKKSLQEISQFTG